jgi:ABC-type transport system involved in Fe-S cluster assembly fused permease/ATPase subunit
VTELLAEFSSSAYLTDTQVSRLKRIPAMEHLMKGRTSLMIAHRLTTLRHCNAIMEIFKVVSHILYLIHGDIFGHF